jgi:DMSO/TMAO reductase YedYZ molybdopterin-dependent catalytic subunit
VAADVHEITRREFLNAAAGLVPAAALFQPTPDLRYIGTVPFGHVAGRSATPLGRLLGSGLNARLFTDLSAIPASASPIVADSGPIQSSVVSGFSRTVTPTEKFFVRTAAPASLPKALDPNAWAIDVGGLVDAPSRVTMASLDVRGGRSATVLLECSGNTDPANYGLLSAADWEGVPIAAVLDRLKPSARAWRVLVAGLDDEADQARSSVPGASWIFSRDDLERALLVTRMNGAPLPRDHGSPVRLIVAGWYGCTCIKWVNRIELVADDVAATSQMREFAARTHQPFASQPELDARRAREFVPAIIDTAAMPVRVEKWAAHDGHVVYRIAGIIWGGSKPTNALSIRVRSNLPWTRVDDCPLPSSTDTWSLWTHTWRPESPGRYTIVLRVDDPSVRTRRLDLFFYARDIQIDEV